MWRFERPAVQAAVRGENPNLRIPGPGAIAHHLIKDWAFRTIKVSIRAQDCKLLRHEKA